VSDSYSAGNRNGNGKPNPADLGTDDAEYNPAVEPKSSKAWLNLLEESEDAFQSWNDHCDKIDKQFASLERLANQARDKQYQMFWANCEVIKPAIYSKCPVPVVVPKFKDRRPVPQAASELLERCATVAFDLTYIDELMKQVRDDITITGRGVPWCRYEEKQGDSYYDYEKVCIDFKHRKDFLHSISRCWYEVSWVAAASYLTRAEARERFHATSGDAYQMAEYAVDREAKAVGGADNRERAKFWEIWHKGERRVCWVAKGCDVILDEDDPHLDLRGFFPCPKPAYGTCQRGSLVPVPDVLQYKDQLEEINMLTSRIHALSDALEAKGFYPAGGGELADAVEAAVKMHSPGRMLVPISNWAVFGGTSTVIEWLPIDQIVNTITGAVTLRKQIIDDIYQITGMADIMRGDTDPNETLGAQQLKTQYGSTRIRDKQYELVRLARDLVEVVCEIITEKFSPVTIIQMSQTQLPTKAMIQQQIQGIVQQLQQQQAQAQQLMQNPQAQQMAQQNPQAAQQAIAQFQQAQQQAQQEVQKLEQQPTIEQVLTFLKSNRSRAFVLDIETDSTIMADENADKQRRTEFLGMLSTLLPQLSMMIAQQPQTAEFCGELLKFAVAPFRAGRTLDGAVDGLVEQIEASAGQNANNKPDDPITAKSKADLQIEQMKIEYQKGKDAQDAQLKVAQMQLDDKHATMQIQAGQQTAAQKAQAQQSDAAEKAMRLQQQAVNEQQAHQAKMAETAADIQLTQTKAHATMSGAQVAAQAAEKQNDMMAVAAEKAAATKFYGPPVQPGR
jgi:hypothetical protein